MIHRRAADMPTEDRDRMRGGVGVTSITALLEPGQLLDRGRMFSRVTVPAGASVGMHRHDGEVEFYYVLSGEGDYRQDDEPVIRIGAGDLVSVDDHHTHGVVNTGSQELVFIALILFTDDHAS